MLAMVLNSPAAVAMSIQIVKAFTLMRRMIGAATHLSRRLDALERMMVDYDRKFAAVFDAVCRLMELSPG